MGDDGEEGEAAPRGRDCTLGSALVLAVLIVLSSPSIASTPVTPAILYHVLANDRWGNEVRDQSSGEHQVQVRSISEPIGGGPAGMDAKALGFLVAVPAGIFGALFLVAWALRTRKH